MQTEYFSPGIRFSLGDTEFTVLKMTYEKFNRIIPDHVHGNGGYELHYISEGYGSALIDGSHYELTPGTFYVTGPHIHHSQSPSPEDPMCEYCIYLKLSPKKSTHKDSVQKYNAFTGEFSKTSFWFGKVTESIAFIIESLFTEKSEHRTGSDILMSALTRQLLVKLVRLYEKNAPAEPSASDLSSDKEFVIIEEYFLNQYSSLSLAELAHKLNLSTRQTERLLKKHYGKTFQQKKTEAKMSAAVILLTESKQSIGSVADQLGYSSSEHFSSVFRSYYNTSPNNYRKRTGLMN